MEGENEIFKFKNGISGYTPQDSNKINNDGYSLYFSSLTETSDIQSYIDNNKVLTHNPEYPQHHVEYKIGDHILTKNSTLFVIYKIQPNSCLREIGQLKLFNNSFDENIFDNSIALNYNFTADSSINDYNYIENSEDAINNIILCHHRDTVDRNVYGISIKISDQDKAQLLNAINKMDGKFCNLVVNFYSGLRFEKIIDSSNYDLSVFLDNRYIYSYGHMEQTESSLSYAPFLMVDASILSENKYNIASYQENLVKSDLIKYDAMTDNHTSIWNLLSDAYISYNYNNKEYRKKIAFQKL